MGRGRRLGGGVGWVMMRALEQTNHDCRPPHFSAPTIMHLLPLSSFVPPGWLLLVLLWTLCAAPCCFDLVPAMIRAASPIALVGSLPSATPSTTLPMWMYAMQSAEQVSLMP